jgi:hypothetical protein
MKILSSTGAFVKKNNRKIIERAVLQRILDGEKYVSIFTALNISEIKVCRGKTLANR